MCCIILCGLAVQIHALQRRAHTLALTAVVWDREGLLSLGLLEFVKPLAGLGADSWLGPPPFSL